MPVLCLHAQVVLRRYIDGFNIFFIILVADRSQNISPWVAPAHRLHWHGALCAAAAWLVRGFGVAAAACKKKCVDSPSCNSVIAGTGSKREGECHLSPYSFGQVHVPPGFDFFEPRYVLQHSVHAVLFLQRLSRQQTNNNSSYNMCSVRAVRARVRIFEIARCTGFAQLWPCLTTQRVSWCLVVPCTQHRARSIVANVQR